MISVCMATYNGERYIRRQLDTILPQLAVDDELVISDDSSADGTPGILAAYAAGDLRIRLFTGSKFRSPVFNFEFAISLARGDVIVLADQDDVWLPQKLAVIRDAFACESRRPYLLVLDAQVVDEAERELYRSVLARLKAGPGFWKNLYDNRYLGCCMAFSRDLLERALPFPRQIPMHDIWLGQLCERVGKTAFIHEVTMQYRKHGSSLTDFRIKFQPLLQIRRRLILAWHLLSRSMRGARNEEKGTRNEEKGTRNEEKGTRNEEKGTRNEEKGTRKTSNLEPRTSNLNSRTSNLISIIMPSYNQVQFLEEAVRSVMDQKGVDVELLVMDPGSSDGSRELLLRLAGEYGKPLRLIFETDSGQSDAVNRGMNRASGTILGWLNSDDRLRAGALARIVATLGSQEPAWVYGRAGMMDEGGGTVTSFIAGYKNWRGASFSRWKLLTENFIPQMAVFWNRQMWNLAGGLNCTKHLDMDYDLWLRFALISAPVVLHDELADFRVHGAAKGSMLAGRQLDDALATARSHAHGLGLRGALAIALHRLFSLRTRLLYFFLKP